MGWGGSPGRPTLTAIPCRGYAGPSASGLSPAGFIRLGPDAIIDMHPGSRPPEKALEGTRSKLATSASAN